jgi:hypothetical protein
MKTESTDNILDRNVSTNNLENNTQNNIIPIKENIINYKKSDSENSLQGNLIKLKNKGKKRSRDRQERISQMTDETLKFKSCDLTEKCEKGIDVEVKLICDLPNEDMKKAFSKSVRLNFESFSVISNNIIFFFISNL